MESENRGKRDYLLFVVDVLISCAILTPLSVAFWRGTWMLINFYILPNDAEIRGWLNIGIALVLITAAYFLDGTFKHHIKKLQINNNFCNKIIVVLFTRVYTYVFAVSNVSHWTGVWELCTIYLGKTWLGTIIPACSAAVLLMLLRGYCNVVHFVPLGIARDGTSSHFKCTTRFKTKYESNWWRHILDVLLTTVVIHSLVVVYWRGMWMFLDIFLFPRDVFLSAMTSFALGYLVTIAMIPAQFPAARAWDTLRNKPLMIRLLFEDSYSIVASLGPILLWRGYWMLYDEYIFPNNAQLSYWITHAIGFCVMVAMITGNTLLGRGCMVDGGSQNTTTFTLQYLEDLLREKTGYKDNFSIASTDTIRDENDLTVAHITTNYQPQTPKLEIIPSVSHTLCQNNPPRIAPEEGTMLKGCWDEPDILVPVPDGQGGLYTVEYRERRQFQLPSVKRSNTLPPLRYNQRYARSTIGRSNQDRFDSQRSSTLPTMNQGSLNRNIPKSAMKSGIQKSNTMPPLRFNTIIQYDTPNNYDSVPDNASSHLATTPINRSFKSPTYSGAQRSSTLPAMTSSNINTTPIMFNTTPIRYDPTPIRKDLVPANSNAIPETKTLRKNAASMGRTNLYDSFETQKSKSTMNPLRSTGKAQQSVSPSWTPVRRSNTLPSNSTPYLTRWSIVNINRNEPTFRGEFHDDHGFHSSSKFTNPERYGFLNEKSGYTPVGLNNPGFVTTGPWSDDSKLKTRFRENLGESGRSGREKPGRRKGKIRSWRSFSVYV
ncbi:unnamed protein product [Owenia fusiformis]|uniref:Uncharacterized protein n=1 Tax=Owenia fusiformis TaxID=6347 RepID=A0A8S4PG47_OWEFU|nr:unnamed protein product [Owenia fusiformis]